jgi:hypothetical protein
MSVKGGLVGSGLRHVRGSSRGECRHRYFTDAHACTRLSKTTPTHQTTTTTAVHEGHVGRGQRRADTECRGCVDDIGARGRRAAGRVRLINDWQAHNTQTGLSKPVGKEKLMAEWGDGEEGVVARRSADTDSSHGAWRAWLGGHPDSNPTSLSQPSGAARGLQTASKKRHARGYVICGICHVPRIPTVHPPPPGPQQAAPNLHAAAAPQ